MVEHCLKCETEYFEKVKSGEKRFEVRKNDRDFKIGDTVSLQEVVRGEFTGRELPAKKIIHILHGGKYGISKEYCVMQLKDIPKIPDETILDCNKCIKLRSIIKEYEERFGMLIKEQDMLREPERTIVYDIVANGQLLPDPNGTRYGELGNLTSKTKKKYKMEQKIIDAVKNGRIFQAMAMYKQFHNCGLLKAKQEVTKIRDEMI